VSALKFEMNEVTFWAWLFAFAQQNSTYLPFVLIIEVFYCCPLTVTPETREPHPQKKREITLELKGKQNVVVVVVDPKSAEFVEK
jgi:hypothetical protein